MNIDTIKEMLAKIPKPKVRGVDFNTCDWSGRKYDDACDLKLNDGERELASAIRKLLG